MLLHHIAQEYAHIEDILCVAFGAPNLMATASFDGQVRNSSDMKDVLIAEIIILMVKKDIEIQPGFEHGSSECKEVPRY